MADAQAVTAGLSIGPSGDTLGGLVGMNDVDSISKSLGVLKQQDIAAKDKAIGNIDAQFAQDTARVEEARKVAAFDPNAIKPWNADEEAAKRRTDPLEAFGSFGSVFGILASLFTKAPMENALNASAAAMNAIKEGDKLAYERAAKAHAENTKLALENHKIQHEAYQDAIGLMKTNLAAGEAKLRILANRFGDQQALFLLENGLSQDVIALTAGRQKLATGMADAEVKLAEDHAKLSRLYNMPDPEDPNGPKYDPKNREAPQNARIFKAWEQENIALENQKRWGGRLQKPEDALNMQLYEKEVAEKTAAKGGELTAEELQAIKDKHFKKGGTSQRVPKSEEKYINERSAELEAEGKSKADALAIAKKEWAEKTRAITGNRADEIQGKVNRVDNMLSTITKIEDMLKKHNAITGLGGSITRPAETIGNVLGSNETDRRQFERWVLELQEWAPAALNDRNGRPLSAEASKITGIIAGLRVGDTVANTTRAYNELVPLLQTIKQQLQERKGDTPPAPNAAPNAPAAKQPSFMEWPEVK